MLNLYFVLLLIYCLIKLSVEQYPWPIIKPMPIEMATCLRRIPDFYIQSCALESARNWDLSYPPEGPALSSAITKKYCCSTWDTVWCILKQIRNQCTDYQYMLAKNYFYDIGDKVPGCFDYDIDSWRCRLPWWGILLIVLGSLGVLAVIAILVYKCLRKKVL